MKFDADVNSLEDLIKIDSGFAFKSSEWIQTGTPVIKIRNVQDGFVDLSGCSFVSEETAKRASNWYGEIGNTLIALTGAGVGEIGRIRENQTGLINQRVGWVRPKDADEEDYIYYLLRYLKSEIIELASGSAQPNVSPKDILRIECRVPPKVERNAVGVMLAQLDEKILLNNAQSKTLEDIAQVIFKSWFIDFDPVKTKMAGEKPVGMDAATAALFPDALEDSELGLIPKGWNIKVISDFGKVVTGKTPSTKVSEYWGDQVPFVTIPDMHDQILVSSTARALSKQGADSQKSQNVPAGSSMVTCIATPGLVGYATKNCQTNQQINSVIPSEEYPSEWLFWHLRGLIPILIRNSGIGTVFANLNKSDFSNIKSITPTLALRKAFNDIVEPIMELLETLNHESRYLRSIRDGLLPRLISGELLIPEEMLAS